jgi:DNA-binding transcriptional regulator LsrR (DeoR family)
MTTFTDQQARQQLDAVLEKARQEGEVRIKTKDGQEFSVRAVTAGKSPLDIPGVDLHLSAEEIMQAVHEGRER